MPVRIIHADTLAAMTAGGYHQAYLIEILFPVPIRITDAGFDIDTMGFTFASSPHLLNTGDVSETSKLRVNKHKLTLSDADQTYSAIFLANSHVNVQVSVWLAILDENMQVAGAPLQRWSGRINSFEIDETKKTPTLDISVTSHWADFKKVVGRQTNNNSQQAHFPNDLIFEFAPKSSTPVAWGRLAP